MEQVDIALLLLGCGDAPEAAETELRHTIDVHRLLDDAGQCRALRLWRPRSVDHRHQLVTRLLDEIGGLGGGSALSRSGAGKQRQPWQQRRGENHQLASVRHAWPQSTVIRRITDALARSRLCKPHRYRRSVVVAGILDLRLAMLAIEAAEGSVGIERCLLDVVHVVQMTLAFVNRVQPEPRPFQRGDRSALADPG